MMLEEGTPNPVGEQMVEELRWVHSIIRENLAAIRAIAQQVDGGAPGGQIQAQIGALARDSALWTLRINCMRYCSLVHHHHRLEDVAVFPGLRKVNPALDAVIDKLEADHRVVSGQLDAIEAAAARLLTEESARPDLAAGLNKLSEYLLAHLEYEENNISPTLRRLTGWPTR